MANKITTFLSGQTGKQISNIDLLNSIRTRASADYQADIPVLEGARINHATVPGFSKARQRVFHSFGKPHWLYSY